MGGEIKGELILVDQNEDAGFYSVVVGRGET